MNALNDVLFEEVLGKEGHLGLITLNRPQVLNSLSHQMIHLLFAQLKTWANASHIKAVIIQAKDGRAFCAGGDLRLTYERYKNHDPLLTTFFRDEYLLNRLIFHFPKPYIALLDGITMGGGVGISINGSHRVATDKLLFAMPETGIGFFPNVCGTYFLPRLPNKIGYYLGLTGARLTCDDCVSLGLATHKVAREKLPELIQVLAETPLGDDSKTKVNQIISTWNTSFQPSPLLEMQSVFNTCFSLPSMEDILDALRQSKESVCQEAVSMLNKKSPTSLKITLQAFQESKNLNFDACMQQEYRLSSRFVEGHDFIEGIRAVIIDKDLTPHWQPNSLREVTNLMIDKYFSPLTHELI